MDSLTSYVVCELKNNPVTIALCLVLIFQVKALNKQVEKVCRDLFGHIKDHAKGEV
jgi:hypothetical protein